MAVDMMIGERIKKRRLELGMTAEQAAEVLGVSVTRYRQYERMSDKTDPRTGTIQRIADVLGVSPAYIMGW